MQLAPTLCSLMPRFFRALRFRSAFSRWDSTRSEVGEAERFRVVVRFTFIRILYLVIRHSSEYKQRLDKLDGPVWTSLRFYHYNSFRRCHQDILPSKVLSLHLSDCSERRPVRFLYDNYIDILLRHCCIQQCPSVCYCVYFCAVWIDASCWPSTTFPQS